VHLQLPSNLVRAGKAQFVTVDEIDSFALVRGVKVSSGSHEIPEAEFKEGLQKIIGELGEFTDWGGESNDLWTSTLVMKKKRVDAALALKGPGTRGVLTPKKMGKNGDQIQRLFRSPGSLFLLQYWAQIDQSVVEQMQGFAQLKALVESRTIYYGVINGADSARLAAAYPGAFLGG
jgi:hypothetical protein